MIIQSTKFFHFLLRKVFQTCQVYYTILNLFIAFEFMFILKRIFSLPKHLNKLFLQMAWLQVSISVKKLNYVVLQFFCIQLFPTFFMVQVFQGPITLK